MATFIVRIELHYATPSDYTELHKSMEKSGFSRWIKADSGAYYRLPTAEYHIAGDYSASGVLSTAQRVANSTGKSNCVLVCLYTNATWSGLEKYQS